MRAYYALPERPHRLARPRTPPFHGDNRGSNPLGDAKPLSSTGIGPKLLQSIGVTLVPNPSGLTVIPSGNRAACRRSFVLSGAAFQSPATLSKIHSANSS